MRINGIRCDACSKEHLFHDDTILNVHRDYIPDEWVMVQNCGGISNKEPMLFCSTKCLYDYAQKISGISKEQYVNYPDVPVTPQTKMRRFLLVNEEKDIEGVKWSNGCVSIDPEQMHTADMWFYRDWDELKEHHDGKGIQWIDQEVRAIEPIKDNGYHPKGYQGLPLTITGGVDGKPLEIKVDQEVNDARS